MRKSYRNTLLVAVGGFIFLVVVAIAGGMWFFVSHFEFVAADQVAAERSFDEVRRQFGATGPVFELAGREMVLLRPLPSASSSRQVQAVHVLAWSPHDRSLARVTLPMWLLRMSDDPFRVSMDGGEAALLETSLTAEDIARYGPTLVADHREAGGERVLVWTE